MSKQEIFFINDFHLRPFLRKWEKKLLLPWFVAIFGVTVYLQNKDGTGLRFFLIISSFMFVQLIFQLIARKRNFALIYRVILENNTLSIYNKNAILWRVSASEISDIELTKSNKFLGLKFKDKALIIRTQDDSFYFPLESARFKNKTVEEVILSVKQFCLKRGAKLD